MRRIKKTLTPDSNLSSEEIMSWCHEQEDYETLHEQEDYETLIESVTDLIERSDDLLFQARLYKLLSQIVRETQNF